MKNHERVALVTGANRGIGFEIALQLAKLGYQVITTARSDEDCSQLKTAFAEKGFSAAPIILEVTDSHSRQQAFEYIDKQYGRLDILVNNAGVAPDLFTVGWESTVDHFRNTMEVNVYAVFALSQLFLPMMKKQQYGRIVNLSSEFGSIASRTFGTSVAYCSSKAALNMMTKILALEISEQGFKDILINAAAPGWCHTDMGGEQAPLTPEQGADTPIWLATLETGSDINGSFYQDRQVMPW